jgi:hypothetical protein
MEGVSARDEILGGRPELVILDEHGAGAAPPHHQGLLLANEDLGDRVFKFSQATWDMTIVAQVGGVRITAGDVNSAISGAVTLLPRAAGAWAGV